MNIACNAIARCTGLPRARVLEQAALDEPLLRDPDAMVDSAALITLLRFALAHTRDPGLGLRLARVLDLRDQGFWGISTSSRMNAARRWRT